MILKKTVLFMGRPNIYHPLASKCIKSPFVLRWARHCAPPPTTPALSLLSFFVHSWPARCSYTRVYRSVAHSQFTEYAEQRGTEANKKDREGGAFDLTAKADRQKAFFCGPRESFKPTSKTWLMTCGHDDSARMALVPQTSAGTNRQFKGEKKRNMSRKTNECSK